ncbi:hypothetical protein N1027_11655 [Herbiconiux sp. CPCC 205763]|uniref:Lipoprotein n=1 Tax=Herbiconiux aconitum TaxID=2970913 RepID=A0ABT2GV31_9MICO|nr:hypothetical protein [Herbiconiux aconitum]MCS5718789.1 hypothetical protein [Herbiconiux aconitum]
MQHSPRALALSALIGSLLLTGCATSSGTSEIVVPTAAASPAAGGSSHTIPLTTNRPSDPPPPEDYDQDSNNRLTAQEASLGQLWALANSEVGSDAQSSVVGPTAGLVDFAAAITTRCYPLRTADEVAELERLKAAYESVIGDEAAFEPARAYFLRATELCM